MKVSVYFSMQMAMEDSFTLMDHIILDNLEMISSKDLDNISIQMETSFFRDNGKKEELYRNFFLYFEHIL